MTSSTVLVSQSLLKNPNIKYGIAAIKPKNLVSNTWSYL